MRDETTVAVIGGGAAGMMAAVAVKEHAPDAKVLLFEKNAYLGAKVMISGGGRCNVTTGIFDVRELLKNYPRGAKFLMTALYHFPPEKVMAWFEEHGVPLKIEKDLRVFPKSDVGKDVVQALEKDLRDAGAEIFCRAQVKNIVRKGDAFDVEVSLVGKPPEIFAVDYVVIATGGNAYRHTGSTGDGYAFAEALGHHLTPFAPSLNSFILSEKWAGELAGVSFEKVALSLVSPETPRPYERIGAFVFTHKGVSGPAIFALSSLAAYEAYSSEHSLRLSINFFPDERAEDLAKRLDELLAAHPKKSFVNILDFLLPKSLCAVFALVLGANPNLYAAHLPKDVKKKAVSLLQNFSLTVIGRSAGEEFVSAGGVDLREVNTNTMESKICPGLFLAGEVLDVDGFTGGFNLQSSWATGRLAGEAIAEKLGVVE